MSGLRDGGGPDIVLYSSLFCFLIIAFTNPTDPFYKGFPVASSAKTLCG